MTDSHEYLRGALVKFFDYPGKATSLIAAYVHDGSSTQAELNVSTKADAEKLLVQLEDWKATLNSIIEKGKL